MPDVTRINRSFGIGTANGPVRYECRTTPQIAHLFLVHSHTHPFTWGVDEVRVQGHVILEHEDDEWRAARTELSDYDSHCLPPHEEAKLVAMVREAFIDAIQSDPTIRQYFLERHVQNLQHLVVREREALRAHEKGVERCRKDLEYLTKTLERFELEVQRLEAKVQLPEAES